MLFILYKVLDSCVLSIMFYALIFLFLLFFLREVHTAIPVAIWGVAKSEQKRNTMAHCSDALTMVQQLQLSLYGRRDHACYVWTMVCAIQSWRGFCWSCPCLRTKCKCLFQGYILVVSAHTVQKNTYILILGSLIQYRFWSHKLDNNLNICGFWLIGFRKKRCNLLNFHLFKFQHRISNTAYNITNEKCTPVPNQDAPVYITIGDGGNIEGLASKYALQFPFYLCDSLL